MEKIKKIIEFITAICLLAVSIFMLYFITQIGKTRPACDYDTVKTGKIIANHKKEVIEVKQKINALFHSLKTINEN